MQKTKCLMESCHKNEEDRCMGKPFSYVSRTGNRLDLNKYDKTHHILTRQTAVGVPDRPPAAWEGIQEQAWKYSAKQARPLAAVAPEFIDPKVPVFTREKNVWLLHS